MLPGPYASLLLSELGAEVWKVENPNRPDMLRFLPPLHTDGVGVAFHALNRGKRHITADFAAPASRERLLRLIDRSDALIESFKPGTLEKHGMSPNVLLARNPRLVICRISGYGQGDLAPGHDLNYLARAGILALTENPRLPPAQIADLLGGAWPAALQVAAYLGRRDAPDFKGRVVDVSMTEGARATAMLPLSRLLAGEAVSPGTDILAGGTPSYAVYPCKEGHLAVAALEPHFWSALAAALDLGEAHLSGPAAGAREALCARFSERTATDWAEVLEGLPVCVEPVHELRAGAVIEHDGLRLPLSSLDVDPERIGTAGLGAHDDQLE